MPNRAEAADGGLAFLIEPPSLLRHFHAHPPLGFRLLGDQRLPAFAARLDLLTSAEPALRRRVQSWPGYRWWGRLLRWKTAFIGSTCSEYMVMPRDLPLADMPARWRALGRGRRLVVVKDIPQRSPLLSAEDNALADRLAEACEREGFLLLQGQALAYVPLDFTDTEEYLLRLSSGRRKNFRRKLRSLQRLDVRTVATGDACYDDEATIDRYHALYRAVYAQSELHFDELGRDHLAAVLGDASSGGTVFEYRLHDGTLIGWNLCFESRGLFIDKTIGLAYPAAREHDLYFVSWFVNLDHALKRGCSHYVAGWTDPEVKARLGAQFTFTRHAVYIRNPLLRAALKPLAHWFEGDQQALAAAQ